MSLSDKLIFDGLGSGGISDDHCVVQRDELKKSIKELKEKQCKFVVCDKEDQCTNCKIIAEVFGVRLTEDK